LEVARELASTTLVPPVDLDPELELVLALVQAIRWPIPLAVRSLLMVLLSETLTTGLATLAPAVV
jgi:hypothetical protein